MTQLFVFDAKSGTYMGRWVIGDGIAIDCIGTFTDNAGRVTLIVLGSKLDSVFELDDGIVDIISSSGL